jgi:alkylation response protein AidB-like acyl-CoA dehydrogenase
MDFGLNELQERLRNEAREFFSRECPTALVRKMEEDEQGYVPDLWHKMAAQGWLGLIFPSEYGGSGGNFLDLTVLLEEMGRALVPVPFLSTIVCCGLPILEAGTEEQKKQFIPQIVKGQLIFSLALTEPSVSYTPSGITVAATIDGNDYLINGTKLFVPDVRAASYLLCATRTKEAPEPEEGITLFLVDSQSQGLDYTLLKTIAYDQQYEVILNNVRVPQENILGKPNQGWPIIARVMDQAAIALCALMIGGAQRVIEMTVAHAQKRVQFGRPIGSFQAIQHKCADMLTDAEAARFITYQAAWKLAQGLPYTLDASLAKAWVSEAYRRICIHGQQIHGGIGIIKEHDMQLYFRRAKVAELVFGDSVFHRDKIAREMNW